MGCVLCPCAEHSRHFFLKSVNSYCTFYNVNLVIIVKISQSHCASTFKVHPIAIMSAGFGWSVSDVVLLTMATLKVIKALDQDRGAVSEYQRATRSLRNLEATLNEVWSILDKVKPVFRNALAGQLDVSTSSIGQFHERLVCKYGEALSGNASNSFYKGFSRKLSWTFSAAEELSHFRLQLLDQLNTVKFLMITHVWYEDLLPCETQILHNVAKNPEGRLSQTRRSIFLTAMLSCFSTFRHLRKPQSK